MKHTHLMKWNIQTCAHEAGMPQIRRKVKRTISTIICVYFEDKVMTPEITYTYTRKKLKIKRCICANIELTKISRKFDAHPS